MHLKEVYVGLGGNIGDSFLILNEALKKIQQLPEIHHLVVSRFYKTTPVSHISQDAFVNAVCRFETSLSARQLADQLQAIEKIFGKKTLQKNAPRILDLDILFYGTDFINEPDLKIPHPRWSERLFVVTPLADLVTILYVPHPQNHSPAPFNVHEYLQNFPNVHKEIVIPI